MYEQRELSGSLFKNKNKKTDNHPNLTGSVLINGKEYWINGWTKESEKAGKWISLSFSLKEPKVDKQEPRVDKEPEFVDSDLNDLPF